jgi:hypothetical protein
MQVVPSGAKSRSACKDLRLETMITPEMTLLGFIHWPYDRFAADEDHPPCGWNTPMHRGNREV